MIEQSSHPKQNYKFGIHNMCKTNTNILKAMYITNHSNLTEQNKYIPLFQLLAMSTYNTYINTKAFSCSYSSTEFFCFFGFVPSLTCLNIWPNG